MDKFLWTPECHVGQIHSCKIHTRRNYHGVPHHLHHTPSELQLPVDNRGSITTLLADTALWRWGINKFWTSQAELCLQPLDGSISNSCQLLLIRFAITWDYTLHCPTESREDISGCTGDSPSASPEITTHNSTVFDLKPEQHIGQNHT